MTDDELDELFGITELSKPYAYADISTSSIIPRPRVLLLPTVWSPTDELLTWAGLAPAEEGNREVRMKGSPYQQLPPTLNPQWACSLYNIIINKTFTLKNFVARWFL